ncbi:hypothetical protein J5N97_002909 [Dioscorea zingiberensis]|uniref:Uncharacterized protein n=1 Tax=Dioscorea zingiberensis TaxID=325984 RepID=A0A9D5D3Q2_9LILI|nr:hypothetical protein J5N97_002909 [Dioscorea zingiberensis]
MAMRKTLLQFSSYNSEVVLRQTKFKGWASRTCYSDNGSTAIEITLKMAFHKFSFDQGIALDSDNGILGGRCYDFKLSSLHSFVIVVVTCLIWLQFGRVIVHLKDHREKIVHWTGPSLGLLKLGFALDFFGLHAYEQASLLIELHMCNCWCCWARLCRNLCVGLTSLVPLINKN